MISPGTGGARARHSCRPARRGGRGQPRHGRRGEADRRGHRRAEHDCVAVNRGRCRRAGAVRRNLPGAGGTVGLGRLGRRARQRQAGRCRWAWASSAPSTPTSRPHSLADTTPIARLTEEPDIVVVAQGLAVPDHRRAASTAWKAEPRRGCPVGGGSSPGGPDHLAPMLMAKAAGIAPEDRQLHPVRRRRRAARLGPRRQGRLRRLRRRRVPRPDQGRRAAGARGDRRRARRRASTRPRSRSPASTSSSPTGAASSPRPASPTTERDKLVGAVRGAARLAGVEGRREAQRLGRRLPAPGDEFGRSWTARTSAWHRC